MILSSEQALSTDITLLIVGCHKDKKLLEERAESKYEVAIQAGAALTDSRIYPYNDFDNFEESISDRNQRYSEYTAIYWAYYNVNSSYIGIEHYRRRFQMTDSEIEERIREGYQIITLETDYLRKPMGQNLRELDFAHALDVSMEIIREMHPEDYERTVTMLANTAIHKCSMNIWEKSLYREYCEWLFPMLDAFYHMVPRKKDFYLRRDVGFFAERMTSLFVEKKKAEGVRVFEAPMIELRSEEFGSALNVDFQDPDKVVQLANKLYLEENIWLCHEVIFKSYIESDQTVKYKLAKYFRLFVIYDAEKKECEKSLFEYLPEVMLTSLKTVLSCIDSLEMILREFIKNPENEEVGKLFDEYVSRMGFSECAVNQLYQFITEY